MNNKEKIIRIIEKDFAQKRVLVLGDLMIDEYIMGKVKRISPEAPVPVLKFADRNFKAGGASNVAENMKALGSEVLITGVANEDSAGYWLRNHFSELGIKIDGIIKEEGRPTTVKTRFSALGQQLLRVDNEVTECIKTYTQNAIIEYLNSNIKKIDAMVLSDYRKGVLEDTDFLSRIIQIGNQNNILIGIDSKSKKIEAFKNVNFVKPNNLELEEAVGIKIVDEQSLNEAGKKYLQRSKAKCLIVTRGAEGISVFLPEQEREDFASKASQVFDVTGAGDTVISTIVLGMVSGLKIEEAVQVANFAASIVVNKVGTAIVSQDELIGRINEE